MLNTLKESAWSAVHALGYDIHRSHDVRTVALASSLGIDLLIDVGANRDSTRCRGGQVDIGEKLYRLNR